MRSLYQHLLLTAEEVLALRAKRRTRAIASSRRAASGSGRVVDMSASNSWQNRHRVPPTRPAFQEHEARRRTQEIGAEDAKEAVGTEFGQRSKSGAVSFD